MDTPQPDGWADVDEEVSEDDAADWGDWERSLAEAAAAFEGDPS